MNVVLCYVPYPIVMRLPVNHSVPPLHLDFASSSISPCAVVRAGVLALRLSRVPIVVLLGAVYWVNCCQRTVASYACHDSSRIQTLKNLMC